MKWIYFLQMIGILGLGGVGGSLIVYNFSIQDGRFAGILYIAGMVIIMVSMLYEIHKEN